MSVDTSYPYAVGQVKAIEHTLLDAAMWNRLHELNETGALTALAESGYGHGVQPTDIDALIRGELGYVQNLLAGICPDPGLIGLLLIATDAHNAKVLFKARLLDSEEDALLMQGGGLPLDLLATAIKSSDYDALPSPLREDFIEIEERLTPDTPAGLLSAWVDSAIYHYALVSLPKHKAPAMRRYLLAKIDFTNTLTLLRAKALGWDAAQLKSLLIDGGTVEPAAFAKCAELSEDETRRVLRPTENGTAIDTVLTAYAQDGDLTACEGVFEKRLNALLAEDKDDSFGVGPLLYFLMQKQTEAKRLRLLFAEKRAAQK